MNMITNVPAGANDAALPNDKTRLIELDDAIAKIRIQIATADLERQKNGKKIDPDWFHKAHTALRHLQRERAEVSSAGSRSKSGRRDKAKDAIIATLRERFDTDAWDEIILSAHLRIQNEEAL